MSAAAQLPGLQCQKHCSFDEHVGSKENLIAAGLASANQFPGEPGGNKLVCTYHRGTLLGKGGKPPERDQDWMQIKRLRTGTFAIRLGIDRDERHRRWEIERAKFVKPVSRRVQTPRATGHLRLVWSAPSCGGRS